MSDLLNEDDIKEVERMRNITKKGLLQMLFLEQKNDFINEMIKDSIERLKTFDEIIKTRKYKQVFYPIN
jgi:hypothetical protein